MENLVELSCVDTRDCGQGRGDVGDSANLIVEEIEQSSGLLGAEATGGEARNCTGHGKSRGDREGGQARCVKAYYSGPCQYVSLDT